MVTSRRQLYARVGQRVWQRVFQRFLHWIYRHRVLVLAAVALVVLGVGVHQEAREDTAA